jgi:hypothetical protein
LATTLATNAPGISRGLKSSKAAPRERLEPDQPDDAAERRERLGGVPLHGGERALDQRHVARMIIEARAHGGLAHRETLHVQRVRMQRQHVVARARHGTLAHRQPSRGRAGFQRHRDTGAVADHQQPPRREPQQRHGAGAVDGQPRARQREWQRHRRGRHEGAVGAGMPRDAEGETP